MSSNVYLNKQRQYYGSHNKKRSSSEVDEKYLSKRVKETKESFEKTATIEKISRKEIESLRFSQLTVDCATRNSMALEELKGNIQKYGWYADSPLHIVSMPDGKNTSLDNRRLLVLKELIQEDSTFQPEITVLKYSFKDKADPLTKGAVFTRIKEMPNGKEIEKKLLDIAKENQIEEGSYGYCVLARLHTLEEGTKQVLGIPLSFSSKLMGFDQLPTILTNKTKQHILRQNMMMSRFYRK